MTLVTKKPQTRQQKPGRVTEGKASDAVYQRSARKITGCGPFRDLGQFPCGGDVCTALAVSTGFDAEDAGTALHMAVNRLAAAGALPIGVSLLVIWPAEADERALKTLMRGAKAAAKALNIPIGAADVHFSASQAQPLVTVTATGRAGGLFESHLPAAGQDIIMAGYAGWQGGRKLARLRKEPLTAHFSEAFLEPLYQEDQASASVLKAAAVAAEAGASVMYASDEGGIYSAIWELAASADLGARVTLKSILLRQETVEVCDHIDVSPYQLLSCGCLLIAADHGQQILGALAGARIPAAVIGHLTEDSDRVIISDDEVRYLEPFRQDSLQIF